MRAGPRRARRSGRGVSALPFHRALGYFEPVVIAEGILPAIAPGTVGPGFDRVGPAVPALLRSGLSVDLPRTRAIRDEKRHEKGSGE